MYLVNTRPDICYAVSALSQFMCKPRYIHLVAAKHILRSLCETIGYGLKYTSTADLKLQGYTNSDWAGSVTDRKSTFGCCFNLGSAMISWCSRKQTSLAISTAKAKYIAACVATREVVWLRNLLARLFGQSMEPTVIHYDNQSYVKLSINPVFHDRTKHVEIKYHYIKDMVQRKAIQLRYICTDEQTADILTKPLSRLKFVYFREKLEVVENKALAKRETQHM